MDLHPLVAGFTDVADEYELGRPGYPPAAVAAIARGLGLADGARIADVGAGTGKLSRVLLAAGFEVVAVEPLPRLRGRLQEVVPGAEAVAGTAEALPLADASVDAVVSADAFHWFDAPRAVAEFARVIRPGGGLALLWHDAWDEPDPQPWRAELSALVAEVRPEHPGYTEDQGRGAVVASPAFGELARTVLHERHDTDAARILAHIASMSWVGGLPEPERRALLDGAREVLARHGVGAVSAPLTTTLWTTRRH
jgi:SAM-dependent methyltransferase